MAKVFKITELNYKGFDEIRTSSGVAGACKKLIEGKANRVAGIDGYVVEERNYKQKGRRGARTGYALVAKDYPAIQDNLDNNTLEKLIKG